MTEEQVTKSILAWLIDNNWNIVCMDFPQSGTGRVLHPNNGHDEKNKNSIIPDIVAVKDDTCLFFENKDRFFYPDYIKVNELIICNQYTDDISILLQGYEVRNIYYGVGLPSIKCKAKAKDCELLVDFVVGVEEDRSVSVLYNPKDVKF